MIEPNLTENLPTHPIQEVVSYPITKDNVESYRRETARERFPNIDEDHEEIVQGIIDAGFWNDD